MLCSCRIAVAVIMSLQFVNSIHANHLVIITTGNRDFSESCDMSNLALNSTNTGVPENQANIDTSHQLKSFFNVIKPKLNGYNVILYSILIHMTDSVTI